MSLTYDQLITLGTDIRSRATEMGWNFVNMFEEIAAWYNAMPGTPFVVWRTAISPDESFNAIAKSGGAMDCNNLTGANRECLFKFISYTLNPSVLNTRTAMGDFCGSSTLLKNALLEVSKRNANRIESLLSTGTGTTASPATMGFQGSIVQADVEAAILATA